MEDKETNIEVGKIAEIITEAIQKAIERKAMANEVVLVDASGVRTEMSSNNTSIQELTIKAHKSFNRLKQPNGKSRAGYIE